MKHSKIYCLLALSTILALLLSVSAATTQAAGGVIKLDPKEGKIGDWIKIDLWAFEADETVHLYFSSDEADEGDDIDRQVTAYERISGGMFNCA